MPTRKPIASIIRSPRRDGEGDAAVLLLALLGIVRRDRFGLPITLGIETILGRPALDQRGNDGFGAGDGQT